MFLNCDCGSELFTDVWQLRRHQTGSVISVMAGKVCLECKKRVDTAALVKIAEERGQKKEIENVAKEIVREATRKAVKRAPGAPLPDPAA